MTEAAKHTPGPWVLVGTSIKTPKGDLIANIAFDMEADEDLEGKANANLLVAAPDMLDALRESAKQLDAIIDDGIQTDWRMWRDDLNAALAKVEGR